MKTIGIVTTSRADYGLYKPIIREIEKRKDFKYLLIVTGTHLSRMHGYTLDEILKDGFKISEQGEILLSSDSCAATVKSMGLALDFYAGVYERNRLDILMVLGDRFEMFCAALAALPFNIPIAHIHGGEVTEGAFDDNLRHSMTKLSHLHFVATEEYKRRVIQLGEDPDNVFVCGAPSLDNLKTMPSMTRVNLEKNLNLDLKKPYVIVTLHPETIGRVSNSKLAECFLNVCAEKDIDFIVTMPNADPGGNEIRTIIKKTAEQNDKFHVFENLGTRAYFSLMKYASAMAGNSSSGIIEAASFRLPVVNVGNRQKGRVRGINVIDCGFKDEEIHKALGRSLDHDFRLGLKSMKNPYWNGGASNIIVKRLSMAFPGNDLIRKKFYDFKVD
jgi:UDP-hydrolysing UDP-N-acetyl-D-glucosamine 2-epimerase